MALVHPRDQLLRRQATADRLLVIANRGLAVPDEFTDIWMALDILSDHLDCGADLLELEEILHVRNASVHLSATQRKERRLAASLLAAQGQA